MIAIINYGLGNITSFQNIFNQLNLPYRVASSPKELESAEKVILPGVGSFDHAMKLLNKSGMRVVLEEMVLEKKLPILGICVGMQILGKSSDEGSAEGLGFINGHVKKFLEEDIDNLPLPHMGWNGVDNFESEGIYAGIRAPSKFYFLHSYYFECEDRTHSVATSDYGKRFSCGIRKDNVYGVQFHPEKSHANGIRLLENFGRSELC